MILSICIAPKPAVLKVRIRSLIIIQLRCIEASHLPQHKHEGEVDFIAQLNILKLKALRHLSLFFSICKSNEGKSENQHAIRICLDANKPNCTIQFFRWSAKYLCISAFEWTIQANEQTTFCCYLCQYHTYYIVYICMYIVCAVQSAVVRQ